MTITAPNTDTPQTLTESLALAGPADPRLIEQLDPVTRALYEQHQGLPEVTPVDFADHHYRVSDDEPHNVLRALADHIAFLTDDDEFVVARIEFSEDEAGYVADLYYTDLGEFEDDEFDGDDD